MRRFFLFYLGVSMLPLGAVSHAQITVPPLTAVTPVAPIAPPAAALPPPGIYYAPGAGSVAELIPLDRVNADLSESYKPSFSFDITKTAINTKARLEGARAKLIIKGERPVFYFYLMAPPNGGFGVFDARGRLITAPYSFRLLSFRLKNGGRVANVGVLSLGGGTAKSSDSVQVNFVPDHVAPDTYRVTLIEPLLPGHYGFINVLKDGKIGDDGVSPTVFAFTVE
jgi:hypothetical protein